MSWGLSPSKCVQQAAKNTKIYLGKISRTGFLAKVRGQPVPCNYAPKENVTPLLEPTVATHFMQLIGVFGWMCELGWIVISTEISMLSSFATILNKGHMEVAPHVFFYLKSKGNSRLNFNLKEPNIGKSTF